MDDIESMADANPLCKCGHGVDIHEIDDLVTFEDEIGWVMRCRGLASTQFTSEDKNVQITFFATDECFCDNFRQAGDDGQDPTL